MKPKTDPEYKLALEIEQMARRHTLDFLIECGRVRKEQSARSFHVHIPWPIILQRYVDERAARQPRHPHWMYADHWMYAGGAGGGGSLRTITIGGPPHVL